MGKAKKTRKYAVAKKMLSPSDQRLQHNQKLEEKKKKKAAEQDKIVVAKAPVDMFFTHNPSLGPPYHILVDTNFINFAIRNKLDLMKAAMDCLLAKCTIYITECVIGELEKLGDKYRVALRIAKDQRFERIPCPHKGTYADDCLVQLATQHRCYIVATCDRDLKRRLRKVPGVPIMYIAQRRFSIERLPDAYGAPAV